jgi:sugar phosphate isomerase/epimerase
VTTVAQCLGRAYERLRTVSRASRQDNEWNKEPNKPIMTAQLGLQLYSVRDQLAVDFIGVIKKIAAMGYAGVEAYGGMDNILPPGTAAQIIKDTGLQIFSTHNTLPTMDASDGVIDRVAALGCKYLVCPWLDPQMYFQNEDGVKRACELINIGNQIGRANGLVVGYHNHDFEYSKMPGSEQRPIDIMLKELDRNVFMEVDTYWVQVAGIDPVEVVKSLGKSAPLLHIKDGPADSRESAMVAVGDGVMDVPAIIKANRQEWAIVELDRCATDMLKAVEKSAHYMIERKLARGR